MDQIIDEKGVNWQDIEFEDSTMGPDILVAAITEDVPTLTVATIIGVAVVVIVAIVAVFLLGVLIDCRQQRMLNKMEEVNRLKYRRRGQRLGLDAINIADNMEEQGISEPPARTSMAPQLH